MNYNILVVEDDLEIQELIKQFLMTQNYNIEVASDGVEGIKRLNTQSFDLILLDVMMPNLNGFEVAKMLRNHSNIPIIFLTALEEEQDQMKGFDLGIDDYITKPFSFHVLIRRVQAVLRRSNHKSWGNHLNFNELNVDCDGYKAYVNKEEIPLTTKEFEILQLRVKQCLKKWEIAYYSKKL